MKKLFILFILITLSGCSAANRLTIVELGTSGNWTPFASAEIAGIRVIEQGSHIKGLTIEYKSGTNTVKYGEECK